uniref:Protein YIPF n=2 Tax=Strombidium inclinatum TaxID=197538 RepID=A0A7S3MUM9_9SPIT|mmetsp:Transcript_2273/g.3429  ORF Transcript_2273/g.3429 Transcript_2273/m.3429 type:complete len:203 (+) Transcript_2273:137-745(+)|eukprot:CAMPEP_0170480772 /NCGR_PEP_ID=MMETSP0208-20121228/1478_1 /TAXON_ID=197538 /ORGANISM="Strombidium inclinatum, Strain S3" /LENGTH=202 /DNA_ID=CAMNT_0010753369 /DNA_START=165 /DNA_END=773 /DNA_ORIENTATION=+
MPDDNDPLGLNTLEEPVSETIKRDLMQIYNKLMIVVNPLQIGVDKTQDTQEQLDMKRKEIRNWDLWGPFIFCLILSVVLSSNTSADDSTLEFEIVFVVVWLGGGIISLNGQLLGGTITFFQSICLLGYCLFPLTIAATLNMVLGWLFTVPFFIKLIFTAIAFVWATYSSVLFMKEMVPADRKELAMYPVCLFYLFLCWFIVL